MNATDSLTDIITQAATAEINSHIDALLKDERCLVELVTRAIRQRLSVAAPPHGSMYVNSCMGASLDRPSSVQPVKKTRGRPKGCSTNNPERLQVIEQVVSERERDLGRPLNEEEMRMARNTGYQRWYRIKKQRALEAASKAAEAQKADDAQRPAELLEEHEDDVTSLDYRSQRTWREDEVSYMLRCIREGQGLARISYQLRRSTSAIRNKARKYGIVGAPTFGKGDLG